MPPKKRPPAPVDRPLSKAYLREFSGWSTAYPPGLSEPNSIRVMENVQITREGAARVRPGLQSYLRTKSPLPIVGSHEQFYLPNGKAYLVAVRETVDVGTLDEREIVGFRVIGPNSSGVIVMDTLDAFGFDVPNNQDALSFTSATTYVKYLQIDNKIFALSDAPEGMVMFWVGTERRAKKLASIERPSWDVSDKLTAMHPAGTWVDNNFSTSTRANLAPNPEFVNGLNWWTVGQFVGAAPTGPVWGPLSSLRLYSLPSRENYVVSPLHDVANTGTFGWAGFNGTLSVSGNAMRIATSPSSTRAWAVSTSTSMAIPRTRQRLALDIVGSNNLMELRVFVHFYDVNGMYVGGDGPLWTSNLTPGRKGSGYFTPPSGTVRAQLEIEIIINNTAAPGWVDIKDIALTDADDGSHQAALDGDDGAGYYWRGTPNDSRSILQPTRDLWLVHDPMPVIPQDFTVSADFKATAGKQYMIVVNARDRNDVTLATNASTGTGDGSTVSRLGTTITAPAGTTNLDIRFYLLGAGPTDELIVDAVLVERSNTVGTYFSGATPNSGSARRRWIGTPHGSVSLEDIFNPILPSPQIASPSTLVSSSLAANRHTFSFFYTISNELGESAASQVTSIKVQRPWSAWQWLDPNGADTNDPKKCVDQLIVTMPQTVFDSAVASGATRWTAYYYYQGPNDAPPVTAIRFAEIDLTQEPVYDGQGYAQLTPQMVKLGVGDPLIPSETTRFNASNPMKGSQGLVAADRLILVGNPADPARISWSSGAPGDYFNFSSLLGGGAKQLTSGNLYVTSCVKLWQNPQSVDTLTILNSGGDGRSNAYYMQPAQITSMSESISVMGFEEITSMDGTVSPYGCEVVNNGLYRPLFHGLFKSTANNYNLSTRSVTDNIQNVWRSLQSMDRIVSSQLDSRIYLLVNNAFGASLEENCRGNEVWVLDVAAKTPTWSRWLVQGVSLRAMEMGGSVFMSIVRPDGIFVFNEDRYTDEKFNAVSGDLETVNIPWYLETNTQGANRAHDAWCNLQQANAHVGNFLGQLRYGIRGQDVNGKPIELEKVLLSDNPPPDAPPGQQRPTLNPTEREDYLLVRKLMKEWVFFAGSVNDTVDNEVTPRFSGGQINSVQYRYTPATVNVGYEYGSVETFEYGQIYSADATTDSGTPKPYVDLSRT